MKQMLSILGSTGSIGTQTLDVARRLGMRVCALAANRNVEMLENQIREWKPQLVAVFDLDAAKRLGLPGKKGVGAYYLNSIRWPILWEKP